MAVTVVMVPMSTSDGTYNVVSVGSYSTVYQSTGSSGSYAGFQYYHRPSGVNFTAGNSLYVEVDYLDQSGSGNIGIQYDSTTNAFQNSGFGLNNSVYNSGAFKTAVYRLDNASFSLAENGGNDMRLTGGSNLQLNIIQVRVSDAPTTLYLQDTAFLGPYTGPSYVGGAPVDATTLVGKTIAGYQGWYGAPGDQDNIGWSHWLNGSQLQIDFWPDMTEYSASERFNFSPYTNSGGSTAQLFSSDEARTTLRHFQWMEAWGIDGVAAQRFVGSVPSVPLDRVLSNVRQAANQTGRTYFVEYDMSGMSEANLVSAITTDWNYLNNTLHITEDPSYLHQNGLPVIGIFGFFTDRFSTTTANAILDIFKNGSAHPAFVLGSGAWWWNEGTDPAWTPAWKSVIYRMGAWQPWNVGNAGGSPLYAGTGYWTDNASTLAANNVMFQPMIYAGCSSVNRDGTAPGSGVPRLSGAVYWNQFSVAKGLNAQTAFIAMFDEFSEGTQIAKATGSPPTNAPNSQVYDGMPSDCYLCLTAQGSRWLKGQAPLAGGSYSSTIPGCTALTKPSIPDPLSPLNAATVTTSSTTFTWSAGLALAGGGSISSYVLNVDGTTYNLGNVLTDTLALGAGSHWWRVQAVNSLGNPSGYSVAQSFTVTAAGTATPSPSPSPSPSRTPSSTVTPSFSPTSTPVVQSTWRVDAGGPGYTDSLGHVWVADTNFVGGTVNGTANAIAGTVDDTLYQTERWGTPVYTFAVPAGSYQVTLRFAELFWSAAGKRVFNVSINGVTVLTNFDIFADSGAAFTADDKVFSNIAPDVNGNIVISLGPASADNATVDAIAIVPMPSSPTPSGTPTASPSVTPSRTPTSTQTRTSVGTATDTVTPSPAQTVTDTATQTWTSAATFTDTVTPSPVQTATNTASPTRTSAMTATQTITPSPVFSPTATSSATLTRTPSGTTTSTRSPSSSATATMTPTFTRSVTVTMTATDTRTVLPTGSFTDTPTQPVTPTFSVTLTASPSPMASSPSPTGTPVAATSSPSPSASATQVATVVPTPTAAGTQAIDGHASILKAMPVPNPNPNSVAVDLDGRAASITLRVYSSSFVLVSVNTVGPLGPGWVQVPLDPGFLRQAQNGTYYYRVSTASEPRSGIVGRLVFVR